MFRSKRKSDDTFAIQYVEPIIELVTTRTFTYPVGNKYAIGNKYSVGNKYSIEKTYSIGNKYPIENKYPIGNSYC